MPRLLELFSGMGSMGRPVEAEGWEVVSVDLDPISDWAQPVLRRDTAGRALTGQLRHGVGQPSMHRILACPKLVAVGSGGRRPVGASRA